MRSSKDNIFIGVTKKSITQFFIGNIDESSTYNGLLSFLKDENHLHPTAIKLFRTKAGKRIARINVPNSEAEYIDEINWPDGIIVKKWLTRRELKQQYQKRKQHKAPKRSYVTRSDQSKHDYGYDYYDSDYGYQDYDCDVNYERYKTSSDRRNRYNDNNHTDWWDYNTGGDNHVD